MMMLMLQGNNCNLKARKHHNLSPSPRRGHLPQRARKLFRPRAMSLRDQPTYVSSVCILQQRWSQETVGKRVLQISRCFQKASTFATTTQLRRRRRRAACKS